MATARAIRCNKLGTLSSHTARTKVNTLLIVVTHRPFRRHRRQDLMEQATWETKAHLLAWRSRPVMWWLAAEAARAGAVTSTGNVGTIRGATDVNSRQKATC
jgi:hypothetical protein